MILVLALTGLAMLLAAGQSPRLGARAHPAHRARLTIAVLLTGFFLVEATLLLWSAPVLLDVVGLSDLAAVCRRMLGGTVPGGVVGGTVAGLFAVLLLATALRGWWRVLRDQRRLRVESVLASHESHEDYDLVILPSSKRMAYTVGGRSPQVVLTSAVVEGFPAHLVDVIIAHEGVHARYRHHRYLLSCAALESSFGWLSPVNQAVDTVRLSLERWADEGAALVAFKGREGVRHALLEVAMSHFAPAASGFGNPESLSARLDALRGRAPSALSWWASAVYLTVAIGMLTAWGSVGWTTRMSILAVVNSGWCSM